MNILITISLVLLIAYTATLCVVNKQIPSSLSSTVFFLPPTGAWLWTVVIAAVVFALAPVLIENAQRCQFLAFIACAGLLFVAGCPLVKDKGDMAYRVHCASAILCAVSAMALVAVNQVLLLLLWLPWFAVFLWKTRGRKSWETKTFWAEMECFLITYFYAYLTVL